MINTTNAHCIHRLFEIQVAKTPNSIAVVFEEQKLTYHDLNEKANQLAHYLKSLGLQPETLVGVGIERSLEMVIALLAILKAGGAYVPLDPAYPKERLGFMLDNSQADFLLTQSKLFESFPNYSKKIVCLDKDWKTISQTYSNNIADEVKIDNLAYVIYTSGSTGKPKGVAMPHRPLSNLLCWQLQNFRFTTARTLQFSPISFDVSFQEIFSTLCSGSTLVLISEQTRRNTESLLQYLSEKKIERLFLPFIALQHLAEVANQLLLPLSLREVITAGEQLKVTRSIVNWFSRLEDCTLYNQYGPSESHVVTSYELSGTAKHWSHLPPIGKPIANTKIYLLEPNLRRKEDPIRIVNSGEAGELAIGGVALAKGYFNQPKLTDSKFIPDPFSDEPGAKLYRTGDLVRCLPDGNIEYLERLDDQVKIRGVRIELGEIEVNLSQHQQVKDVAVIPTKDSFGNKRLVAYVVTTNSLYFKQQQEVELELRDLLKENLPDCMMPSTFMFMNALPLTPSGKVDRRALPSPSNNRPALKEEYVAPSNQIEEKLSEIWSQILEIKPIGINDNFFDLGGDSLQAIQLVNTIREAFQRDLPMVALFDAPTIRQLAESVNKCIDLGSTVTSDHISVLELKAEATLESTINPSNLPINNCETDPNNVFITGVTGYLGAFLLHELLEQTQATVYCLVRTTNPKIAKREIKSNLGKYLIWDEKYNMRIVPVVGDLAKPSLGLSEYEFLNLANTIDVIYHSAAYISLIHPYSTHRTPNVLGTQELLKLATLKKVKPFHFISTLDVFQTSRAFSSELITEDDELNPSEAIYFDGYTKSKWVSEQMVRIAQSRGLPACIYRPAMITGHSQTGAANINDLMNRLIKSFIKLGSAPKFNMVINIASVDYFSKGAIYLSRQRKSWGKGFNFINPQPISMSDFIETINSCGFSIKQVEHQEWENMLMQHIESLDGIVSVLTSKTSANVPSYIERSSVAADQVSCQNVLDGLKETNIVAPAIDSKLLKTYFNFYSACGFIEMPVILNF